MSLLASGGERRSSHYYAVGLLLLLTIFCFANSFPGAFIIDDLGIVKLNPLVLKFDPLKIFMSDYWGSAASSGLYRPLTILSLSENQAIFGHDILYYHLVNVFLHAAVAVSLYFFALSLGLTGLGSWLAAAIFACHPIHTEVVNEVVGRSELLVALFGLLALILSIRSHKISTGAWSAFFYLLALLSKEHAIVLLLIIPVIDYFRADKGRWAWRERLPYYLLLVGVTLLWLGMRTWLVDRPLQREEYDPFLAPLAGVDALTRILTALKVQLLYVQRLFWPSHLQGVYSYSSIAPFVERIHSLTGLLVVGIWSMFGVLVWQGWRRRQFWALALVVYVISFLPTANIFFTTGVTMAERLAYFPSLWFVLGIVGTPLFLTPSPRTRQILMVAGVLVIVGLAIVTWNRNRDFQSAEKLFAADVAADPQNQIAWMFLASSYQQQQKWQEADDAYLRLLKLAPDSAGVMDLYARYLLDINKPAMALQYARSATELPNPFAESAQITLARVLFELGRSNEALSELEKIRGEKVLRLNIYWEVKGKAEEATGRLAAAATSYQQEDYWSNGVSFPCLKRLGNVLIKLDSFAEAEKALRRAQTLFEDGEVLNLLGVALVRQNTRSKVEEARGLFRRAVDLSPENMLYRSNLERSLKQEGV